MVKSMYSDTISALQLTRERHEEEDGKPGRDREMEGERLRKSRDRVDRHLLAPRVDLAET